VLLLTTVYSGEEVIDRIRRRPTTTTLRSRPIKQIFGVESVKKMTVPSVTADYNDLMGAVDIGDQLRASEGLDHRVRKGNWRALAWSFLLETCLVNSFLLQRNGQASCPWKLFTTQRDWRQQILCEIIAAYGKDGASRQRFKSGDIFTPISQHNHVDRKKSSKCLACQGYKAGETRSQSSLRTPLGVRDSNTTLKITKTRRGCDTCNVAICTGPNCWDLYHSGLA
jgi:hypothetical protein